MEPKQWDLSKSSNFILISFNYMKTLEFVTILAFMLLISSPGTTPPPPFVY